MRPNPFAVVLACVVPLSAIACESPVPPARYAGSHADDTAPPLAVSFPASSKTYTTDPTTDSLVGGALARSAETQLLDVLRTRGDRPVGDGRLAQVAQWSLERAVNRQAVENSTVDAVARRVGWVGPTPFVFVFSGPLDEAHPISPTELRRNLDDLPANVPLHRYGIATVSRGPDCAVAVAVQALEVTLEPIPKQIAPNGELRLRGTIGERFAKGHLAVTLPGGKVRSFDSATRGVDGTFAVTETGMHRVELLGDGPSGPVVVANFPVYVGVDEPLPEDGARARGADGDAVDSAAVEASMLALLNETRAAAHLKPVQADESLAAVARSHCADMQANSFFGHVSPSKGTTEDRLRAAHLLYSLVGENVARAASAKEAHETLMGSPAHRDVMLGADFTHVGIGALVTKSPTGQNDIRVTMEFAREDHVELADVPERVREATDMARLPHQMARLQLDTTLEEEARQGAAELSSDANAPPARVIDAVKRAVARDRRTRGALCIALVQSADVKRMDPPPATKDPRAQRMGVAAVRDPDRPDAFSVVLVVASAPNRALSCE